MLYRRWWNVNPWSACASLSISMCFNIDRYEEKSPVFLNHASTCGMVGGIFRLSPVPSPPRHCTKHYSHDSTPSPIAYQHEIVCSQTIFFVSILAISQLNYFVQCLLSIEQKASGWIAGSRHFNYSNEAISRKNILHCF